MEIRLEKFSKSFGPVKVIEDMDLTIGDCEMIALLGPSGCGKTTTLYAVCGLHRVTPGRIWFGATDVTAPPPQTTTVGIDTGYSGRNVASLGREGLRGGFIATRDGIDTRLSEGALVIGVIAGDGAVAFPIDAAPTSAPMQDSVGGVPVVVLEDSNGDPALAYHRLLTDGRVLDFERRDGAIYDVQTGSRWASSGLAVEGELTGVQLAFVTSFFTEWYGWAGFHPDKPV